MSPQLAAGDRLRRLLAMIPWLAERGSATFDEIGQRFGMTEAEIVRELELVAMCGLPPYTPDRLIEVLLHDDGVEARIPDYFRRPMRLTPAEGFAVLAAGRALLAVPGTESGGALDRALRKLEGALGDHGSVEIELDAPVHLAAVRQAAERRERIEIDYYSASRDEMTTRAVDPHQVLSLEGHWYVEAYCHRVEDRRLFRVDRIREVRPSGDIFTPGPVPDRPGPAFRSSPDTRAVTIRVPPDGTWVVETYPNEVLEEHDDGSRTVRFAVGGQAWLERLLLRLGPEAWVVEPEADRTAGADAARRILARYR